MLLPAELEPVHAGESAGFAGWVVLGLVVVIALGLIAFASRVHWIGTDESSYSGPRGSFGLDFDFDFDFGGDGDD